MSAEPALDVFRNTSDSIREWWEQCANAERDAIDAILRQLANRARAGWTITNPENRALRNRLDQHRRDLEHIELVLGWFAREDLA